MAVLNFRKKKNIPDVEAIRVEMTEEGLREVLDFVWEDSDSEELALVLVNNYELGRQTLAVKVKGCSPAAAGCFIVRANGRLSVLDPESMAETYEKIEETVDD